MAERDPFRILVNDLKEDLMKSVDALSSKRKPRKCPSLK